MKILHVLDVKQFMYVGQSKKESICRGIIEDNREYRPNGMRVGSLCYIMDTLDRIDKSYNENDIVLCFDSPPTIKRELASKELGVEYKGGRVKAPEHVTYQYEFAKIFLPQIGYNCLIAEGLEADDLIASVVLKYKSVYDKVIVYSGDSDQYYLVDKVVEIQSIRANGRSVNYENYRSSVKKDRLVTYNCLNLLKLIEAESTDNVPGLRPDVIERVLKMLPPETYPYLGNMTLFRTVFKNIVGEKDRESMAIFDLINPIQVYDERSSIERGKSIDYRMFSFYATLFGLPSYRRKEIIANKLGEATIDNFLDDLNNRR